MGDAISISVPVIVVAIVFVIVVSEGMVAVTVVAMVPIIHIVITPRATVVADEPVYRLRWDSKSLAHVLCCTAYFARLKWLRAEAVKLGG